MTCKWIQIWMLNYDLIYDELYVAYANTPYSVQTVGELPSTVPNHDEHVHWLSNAAITTLGLSSIIIFHIIHSKMIAHNLHFSRRSDYRWSWQLPKNRQSLTGLIALPHTVRSLMTLTARWLLYQHPSSVSVSGELFALSLTHVIRTRTWAPGRPYLSPCK